MPGSQWLYLQNTCVAFQWTDQENAAKAVREEARMAALTEFKQDLGEIQKVTKRTAECRRLRQHQQAEAERIEFDSLLAANINPYEISIVFVAICLWNPGNLGLWESSLKFYHPVKVGYERGTEHKVPLDVELSNSSKNKGCRQV